MNVFKKDNTKNDSIFVFKSWPQLKRIKKEKKQKLLTNILLFPYKTKILDQKHEKENDIIQTKLALYY